MSSVTAFPKPRIRAYQAGKKSPYHRTPRQTGSGDASTGAAGTKLRDWARWLDENNDIVCGALDKLTNFIVGPGITIEPMVKDRRGVLLERVNDEIRKLITGDDHPRSWSRNVNVTGELVRGAQEWITCRTWLRDGEILARRIFRKRERGQIAYQAQLLEADYLPYELIRQPSQNQNVIIHGVEKDSFGQPLIYHVYRQHPGDITLRSVGLLAGEMIEVPAREISHLKFSRRAGQTRGVPIFHAAIHRLDDIADYEDAHRIGARVGAQLLGSIKRSPDMIGYDGQSDDRDWEMMHGQILTDLLPGEDVSWYKPESPNPDATPFIDDQLRRVSGAFGLGYSTVSAKYDKSFSAARQEQSENWPTVERLRARFVSDFVRPCEYETALETAIMQGLITIPRQADPDTIFSADYRGPARPTIDDLKQAQTDSEAIANGTDSRHGRIRERGRDPVKIDTERTADPMKIDPRPSAAPPEDMPS